MLLGGESLADASGCDDETHAIVPRQSATHFDGCISRRMT
ncbi:hypothetical protein RISK_003703 [Rhodopirellula islandica]|uniref:Uncharacterized protein n=1 Tax=Rhodopirellula islandica TaxID=595434 RepID=A0A0J1BBW9_RHOIS|nr:hypothetical protein RISK_003703 [Rhodopirellula islandica]